MRDIDTIVDKIKKRSRCQANVFGKSYYNIVYVLRSWISREPSQTEGCLEIQWWFGSSVTPFNYFWVCICQTSRVFQFEKKGDSFTTSRVSRTLQACWLIEYKLAAMPANWPASNPWDLRSISSTHLESFGLICLIEETCSWWTYKMVFVCVCELFDRNMSPNQKIHENPKI